MFSSLQSYLFPKNPKDGNSSSSLSSKGVLTHEIAGMFDYDSDTTEFLINENYGNDHLHDNELIDRDANGISSCDIKRGLKKALKAAAFLEQSTGIGTIISIGGVQFLLMLDPSLGHRVCPPQNATIPDKIETVFFKNDGILIYSAAFIGRGLIIPLGIKGAMFASRYAKNIAKRCGDTLTVIEKQLLSAILTFSSIQKQKNRYNPLAVDMLSGIAIFSIAELYGELRKIKHPEEKDGMVSRLVAIAATAGTTAAAFKALSDTFFNLFNASRIVNLPGQDITTAMMCISGIGMGVLLEFGMQYLEEYNTNSPWLMQLQTIKAALELLIKGIFSYDFFVSVFLCLNQQYEDKEHPERFWDAKIIYITLALAALSVANGSQVAHKIAKEIINKRDALLKYRKLTNVTTHAEDAQENQIDDTEKSTDLVSDDGLLEDDHSENDKNQTQNTQGYQLIEAMEEDSIEQLNQDAHLHDVNDFSSEKHPDDTENFSAAQQHNRLSEENDDKNLLNDDDVTHFVSRDTIAAIIEDIKVTQNQNENVLIESEPANHSDAPQILFARSPIKQEKAEDVSIVLDNEIASTNNSPSNQSNAIVPAMGVNQKAKVL